MISSNIDLSSIKLIIWDLDDTLWNGTLSEGEISLDPNTIELIKNITDAGVINSICSKNTEADVIQKLREYDIEDLFVFKSINWENKGHRVKQIITNMSLRSPNVLFIDDNISNLQEVSYYNKNIIVADPNIVPDLVRYFSNCKKKDLAHKRLNQYKVLENKRAESLNFSSNEDFLHSCNITLQIHTDCQNEIERLHELVLRSNQLNFTKKRPQIDEFRTTIDSCRCGYVTVQDRFGDYGIVGFYAINCDNELEHFLFSCRTIGQGVEQYVYWKLNFPNLNIIGEVATQLNTFFKPDWITETTKKATYISAEKISNKEVTPKYLFKGPCDMSSMIGYLQLGNNVLTEFTFNDEHGHSIENHNHSAHIYALKTFTEKQFSTLIDECFFLDMPNFESNIFNYNYSTIFLSTLIEGNYGLYRRRDSGDIVAYGHYDYPLTDPNFWDKYVSQSIPTYNYSITREDLEKFSQKYEYIGRTTPSRYIEFLNFLLANTSERTNICLILGSEIAYNNERESTYYDRADFHKKFNDAIKDYAATQHRIKYINLTQYIKSQADFTNNINHFTPNVYFNFSKDILRIIKEQGESIDVLSSNYKRYIYKRYIQPIRAKIPAPLIQFIKPLYKLIFRK